jgi:3-oxoacyl-[acyl-carrier protein] reductase
VTDLLLQIGSNAAAREWLRRLGLPLPLPEPLRRAIGPWEAQPLAGEIVVSGTAPSGATPSPTTEPLARPIAEHLLLAGAEARIVGANLELYRALGEAYGRAARPLDLADIAEDFRADALVFDATCVRTPSELRSLYDYFHALLPKLRSSGRAVVLGRPAASAENPDDAAAQSALEGFVRSLAKEVGRRAATATLLVVHPGAAERVGPVLRFVLSRRSSFVTGQPIVIHPRVLVRRSGAPDFVRALDHKVALVTGAARGIGEATALALAAEGAHVVCLDRPAEESRLVEVARLVGGSALSVDVTARDAPELVARSLSERHGGVDVVVHNAGVTRDKTLARMSSDQWDGVIDVNLASVLRIDEALAANVLRDFGRIICLASVSGIAGNLGQTNYAASKAGIIGFVRKRAEERAERGITVNAVAPGFIETRLTAAMPRMIREAGRRLSALGQGGTPGDVADAVTFLASPGAAGVSGSVLRVCGGALIGA